MDSILRHLATRQSFSPHHSARANNNHQTPVAVNIVAPLPEAPPAFAPCAPSPLLRCTFA